MRRVSAVLLVAAGLLAGAGGALSGPGPALHHADQGARWTPAARAQFYSQDQGARMIPLAWLQALTQPDGRPFLEGALARYGFLPNPDGPKGLPVGFTLAASPAGPMAGMTCAACHTRDISLHGETWRIDGGPAFIDFQSFVADMNKAVLGVLASEGSFAPFARRVLGDQADKPEAAAKLRADVTLWSARLDAWVGSAFPKTPWGPSRVDAMAMIFDRIAGLDVGPAPSYLIPKNIELADAPVRYPFLWNSSRQDHTQWGGWQANGSATLALGRNLGQVYGMFAAFHPVPDPKRRLGLNVDYVAINSANLPGLLAAESLVERMAPPKWPWSIDKVLAARGKTIFDLTTDKGGCVACHGIAPGVTRDGQQTWRTPVADVGTDTHQWDILRRTATSGTLRGAAIPGAVAPIGDRASAFDLLKASVIGAIAQHMPPPSAASAKTPAASDKHADAATMAAMHPDEMRDAYMGAPAPDKKAEPGLVVDGYESRVLEGIWAAAPYLHNGSVPTLAALLTPPSQRVTTFAIGTRYDEHAVGLATVQAAGAFMLTTTGCESRASGNSHCGHDYGTRLSHADKAALLEYLKTL